MVLRFFLNPPPSLDGRGLGGGWYNETFRIMYFSILSPSPRPSPVEGEGERGKDILRF